jgi:hypothetical protein
MGGAGFGWPHLFLPLNPHAPRCKPGTLMVVAKRPRARRELRGRRGRGRADAGSGRECQGRRRCGRVCRARAGRRRRLRSRLNTAGVVTGRRPRSVAERCPHPDGVERVSYRSQAKARHDGGPAAPPQRSARRATARRASTRRATARQRRGDIKDQIIAYLRNHPESTAGDVAKAINANRNTTATRLSQMVKEGEITKVSTGYVAD